MASRIVNITIKAKDRATGVFSKFGSFLKRNFLATLASVTAGLFLMVRATKAVVSAANTQELAEKRLESALISSGQATKKNIKFLKEQASAFQKITTVGDEQILVMQQLFLQFGKVSVKNIAAVTRATIGLAEAQDLDLNSAALLVAKSLGSATNALTRYGVELDVTADESTKVAQLTAGLEGAWQTALAKADTFSGVMKQLSNNFGDNLEKIGDAIIKNKEFKATIVELSETLGDPEFQASVANLALDIVKIGEAAAKAAPSIVAAFEDPFKIKEESPFGRFISLVRDQVFELKGLEDALEATAFGPEQDAAARLLVSALKKERAERAAIAEETRDQATAAKAKAEAEREEAKNAAAKEAAFQIELSQTTSLTKSITLLAKARKLAKEVQDDPLAAIGPALEALGVESDLTAKLEEEARLGALKKQFELLKALNKGRVLSDQQLLTARLNLDDQLRASTLTVEGEATTAARAIRSILEEAAKSSETFAEESVVAVGSVENLKRASDDARISVEGIATAAATLAPSFLEASVAAGTSIADAIGLGSRSSVASLRTVTAEIETVQARAVRLLGTLRQILAASQQTAINRGAVLPAIELLPPDEEDGGGPGRDAGPLERSLN